MTTAELITRFETCELKGHWSQKWRRPRFTPNEMLYDAIDKGLLEVERKDYGDLAGERIMELAEEPGMEMPSDSRHLYESVVHHAALADIVTTALRSPRGDPWHRMDSGDRLWSSGAYRNAEGTRLRRVVLVSSWNDERHFMESRSWHSLGEVAFTGLPMDLCVVVLGRHMNGRRHSPWAKGFIHPRSHQLRFRKKSKASHETFSESWSQVWREDRGEIETREWLASMQGDDILRDVCFTVEVSVPSPSVADRIRRLAEEKLDLISGGGSRRISLSSCDRPRCPFLGCCWSEKQYEPSAKTGFVQIEKIMGTFMGTAPVI